MTDQAEQGLKALCMPGCWHSRRRHSGFDVLRGRTPRDPVVRYPRTGGVGRPGSE